MKKTRVKNHSGLVIDKWTVMDEYKIVGENAQWKVKCECGTERWHIIAKTLHHFRKTGQSSCGCNKIKYDNPNARNTWSVYKSRAKKYNRDFTLTFESFLDIICQPCIYCGSNGTNVGKKKFNEDVFLYNGIDRIDNTKGYVEGNCAPCCIVCNTMKMDLDVVDFYSHLQKIITHKDKTWKI